MVEKMILEVLDTPKELRLIIDTEIPTLCVKGTDSTPVEGIEVSDTLYYMIDRSPDMGETISDVWRVSASEGGWYEIPTHQKLIDFINQILAKCPFANIWVESY